MALENVNTRELRNTILVLKNNANCSSIQEIINSISRSNVWDYSAKNNLLSALNMLVSKYNDLTNKLDYYLGLVDLIEQYQKYSEEASTLETKMSQDMNNRDKYQKIKDTYDGETYFPSWEEAYVTNKNIEDLTKEILSENHIIEYNKNQMRQIIEELNASI